MESKQLLDREVEIRPPIGRFSNNYFYESLYIYIDEDHLLIAELLRRQESLWGGKPVNPGFNHRNCSARLLACQ